MYLTLDEHQRMARAAEADSMNGIRPSPPAGRRTSLNGVIPATGPRVTPPPRPNPTSLYNIVYWPSRAVSHDENPASLDATTMTHLIYTAATVDYDGTVRLSDESPNFGTDRGAYQSSLEACIALKNRNPNLKVLVSVGGTAAGLNYVANYDRLTQPFGNSLRNFAMRHEVDGIEIDWSSARTEQDAERLLKLTASTEGYLSEDFNGRYYELSIALPSNLLQHVNLREANKLLNFMTVKAFDFPTSVNGRSTYHAQVPSCIHTLDLLETRGANMRKVVLGVPCFGRAFIGATAPRQPYREATEIMYNSLPLAGTQESTDQECGAAYCVGDAADAGPDGQVPIFVSYDNPATVERKAQLVKTRGLAGLGFYTGVGDRTDERSLVRRGYSVLLKWD